MSTNNLYPREPPGHLQRQTAGAGPAAGYGNQPLYAAQPYAQPHQPLYAAQPYAQPHQHHRRQGYEGGGRSAAPTAGNKYPVLLSSGPPPGNQQPRQPYPPGARPMPPPAVPAAAPLEIRWDTTARNDFVSLLTVQVLLPLPSTQPSICRFG